MKRGITPVIATVLLIFIVLLISVIVFTWSSDFFSEQLEVDGISVELICSQVKMQAAAPLGYSGEEEILLEISNQGDVDIDKISITESIDGNEITNIIYLKLESGFGTTYNYSVESSDIEKIVIHPVIIGTVVGGTKQKEFTCVENPSIINRNFLRDLDDDDLLDCDVGYGCGYYSMGYYEP